MTIVQRIKTAFERNEKALQLRPALGRKTAVTKVTVIDGLSCEISEGKWKIIADVGENRGGADSGPNPGILGRGALGSCLAIGYLMWAAKLEVPITRLEVEVQADMDVRGEYALAEVPAGYLEVRYLVTITSPAPEAEIMRLLDRADAHSSFVDIFQRAQKMQRVVRLLQPGQEAEAGLT